MRNAIFVAAMAFGVMLVAPPASAKVLCNIYFECWEIETWHGSQEDAQRLLRSVRKSYPTPITLNSGEIKKPELRPMRTAKAR